MFGDIPRSSSGRTEDSGSSNGGSNPSLGIFYTLVLFYWGMRVFEPREFFRVTQNSVVLPFYGTLICTARAARLQLS